MTTVNRPSTTPQAKEWDEVRCAFAASLMVNTPLTSLAQNLDGLDWPLAGEDETPAAYIDLSYEELVQLLTARRAPAAVALLVRILRETLEFDEPFGEMARQAEASAEYDSPLKKALARLNIPEEFPISLTALDGPTREFCQLEHLRTLGHFALFAQDLSQRVIVGGDFRRLLNALAQVDEAAIARLLPFRPGSSGLHLVEALAQAARSDHPAEQTAHALAWFSPEFAEWKREAALSRHFLPRQFAALRDEVLEAQIAKLLASHLGPDAALAAGTGIGLRLRRWLGL